MRTAYFHEAARRIQSSCPGIHARGRDQRRMHPAGLHPAHTLDGRGTCIATSRDVGTAADRYEVAEAIRHVQPPDAVGEEPALRIFEHHVQFGIVNWRAAETTVVFDGHRGWAPDRPGITMDIDARV